MRIDFSCAHERVRLHPRMDHIVKNFFVGQRLFSEHCCPNGFGVGLMKIFGDTATDRSRDLTDALDHADHFDPSLPVAKSPDLDSQTAHATLGLRWNQLRHARKNPVATRCRHTGGHTIEFGESPFD